MGEIEFKILAKRESLVCADGQEEHVLKLADKLDARMRDLKAKLGGASDYKVLLTAALFLIDEMDEAEQDLDRLIVTLDKDT